MTAGSGYSCYSSSARVFVDINSDGNINLDLCEEYIRKDKEIKAIYTVHFSGNPVDQKKLKYLKDKYNIKILEDCSHSLGAYQNLNNEIIKAGSCKYSDCSTLSFHPVKQITSGEGGAITTNDEKIYQKLLRLRSHGMTREVSKFKNFELAFNNKELNSWYYEMQLLGYNYRLTDFQAALGISQLKKLKFFVEKRKEIAKFYNSCFENNEIIKPLYTFTDNSSYHLYVILIDFQKIGISKNTFIKKLLEKGIGSQVHYIPINQQLYYKGIGYGSEETPVMDNYYEKCLSIPLYPGLKNKDIEMVSANILNLIKWIIYFKK